MRSRLLLALALCGHLIFLLIHPVIHPWEGGTLDACITYLDLLSVNLAAVGPGGWGWIVHRHTPTRRPTCPISSQRCSQP